MAVQDYLESLDFTTLRQFMLDLAPADVDSSEGSFLYDALTPIALFLSEIFSQMRVILRESYIGTATGTNLDNLAATMPRIYRYPASAEKVTVILTPYTANILSYIQANSTTLKFTNADGETFNVDVEQEDWLDSDSTNIYLKLSKAQVGRGYSIVGQAFEPSPAINGLESCLVFSVNSSGSEEETDDHLRVRVWAALSKPFLGSLADYQRKIFAEFPASQNGFNVDNCFIIPRGSRSGYICVIPAKWDGTNGLVHCTAGELESLQNYLDKRINGIGGYGLGVAPIGHVVKVRDFTEFRLHIKVTITVATGHEYDIPVAQAGEQIRTATNGYLHSIINEVVPSSTNFRANAQRYVAYFIYYYVNAHEYAVLSALKATFGSDIVKNALIERQMSSTLGNFSQQDNATNLITMPPNSTAINFCYLDGEQIFMNSHPDWQLSELEVTSQSFPDIMNYISFTRGNDSALIMQRNGTYTGELVRIEDCKLKRRVNVEQTDLVIRSGDSKGTLPILGNLFVQVVEE